MEAVETSPANGGFTTGIQIMKELKKKTEALTAEENLELIAHLVAKIRMAQAGSGQHRKWNEIYGVAPYPLAGEDAQSWVTRTRRESDDHREQQWK